LLFVMLCLLEYYGHTRRDGLCHAFGGSWLPQTDGKASFAEGHRPFCNRSGIASIVAA